MSAAGRDCTEDSVDEAGRSVQMHAAALQRQTFREPRVPILKTCHGGGLARASNRPATEAVRMSGLSNPATTS